MSYTTIQLQVDDLKDPFEIVTYIPNQSNGKWIIYLHGLPGGPLNQLKDSLKIFGDLHFPSLTFNYPGLWEAPGLLSYKDLLNSLKAIFTYVDSLNPKKTFLFGESFGGLVSFNIVANEIAKIDKVVLRSPVTDLTPIFHFLPATLQYLQHGGVLRYNPNFIQELDRINPVNLFHKTKKTEFWGIIGQDDEVLPGDLMALATEKQENINLELWQRFPHNSNTENFPLFLEKMIKFLGS